MNDILPLGMDGRASGERGDSHGALQNWQRNASETLERNLERPSDPHATQRARTHSSTAWPSLTAESRDESEDGSFGIGPVQISPRLLQGGEKPPDRRHGFVLQDSYSTDSFDGRGGGPRCAGPPVSLHGRPRNRTVAEPPHQRKASSSVSTSRHRIGSVHSTSSSFREGSPQSDTSTLPSYSPRSANPPEPSSVKSGRRLTTRQSRPTSPQLNMGDVPSVNSLPLPVMTGDANKILMLMKTLCGRMRGKVEYQADENGSWHAGVCYIDDAKGSLMFEGSDTGPLHLAVISDLRGCRVKPIDSSERPTRRLGLSNKALGIQIYLAPMVPTEYDLWLAALLCWQQIRTTSLSVSAPASPASPATSFIESRPPNRRRESLLGNNQRGGTIIKVAKLLLWDKGAPSSPTAIVRRSSTRDLRSSNGSGWRRVSCVLQDNGEFKLLTSNDSTLLSVIQLSQLSRCAIQRLDRSVLDEEYCIAIFPQYTSTSTQLSIFRPVYIALESRVAHEVWFCLLRAFTVPEIYGRQDSNEADDYTIVNQCLPSTNDMFRLEKSMSLRIIEARIRKPVAKTDASQLEKPSKAPEHDPSVGDYFVEVILDGEVRARTKTRTETKNPFWREDCEFLDLPAHLPSLSIVLKQMEHPLISVPGFLSTSSAQSPTFRAEVVCGTVEIPMDKLERDKDNESWWPVLDDRQEQIGELFMRVRHDELVVLLAKDYHPISELLHNFGRGLTLQIAQVIPAKLKGLAEILMNIFQVSGHAGDWLMALIEDEIDGVGKEPPSRRLRWSRRLESNESFTSFSDREQIVRDMGKSLQGEANLLFRGNSLLTQALDFHMRRIGKEYLEEVLSGKISQINTLNPDCEVDPSRILHVGDIDKNWTLLTTLTTDVWESIAGSAERCPPELRQIMKFIRAVTEDRYGDFLRTTAYTSVSGFLFLRFFCPALLNPKLFGLLRDHPQPKAQRTFTLIAKSLQALANLSHFGQKESWMEPMNKFLYAHRQGVKDFLDTICDIPSEGESPLPASYSTPVTILARLPPTSREGFPSLPYLIDHPRNFSSLVKLWLDATTQDTAPQGFEGELLEFHELCLDLRRRADNRLLEATDEDHDADQVSLQWEDIVETLQSSSIRDATSPSQHSNLDPDPHPESVMQTPKWTDNFGANAANHESNQRLPGSPSSETGSKERKERQSFWDHRFGKENKSPKHYDSTTDSGQASPLSREQSRNGKPSRNFLSGLRRKGKGGADVNTQHLGGLESAGSSSTWTGPGGMI